LFSAGWRVPLALGVDIRLSFRQLEAWPLLSGVPRGNTFAFAGAARNACAGLSSGWARSSRFGPVGHTADARTGARWPPQSVRTAAAASAPTSNVACRIEWRVGTPMLLARRMTGDRTNCGPPLAQTR